MSEPSGNKKVWRCPDCVHNHLEHPVTPQGVDTCSSGWCPCAKSRTWIQEVGEQATIPVWVNP